MNRSERGNSLLRGLDRFAGIPVALATGFSRKILKKAALPASPRRIGIICLGGIGDLLLLSALTDGIRKLYPHVSIELVASSANAAALPLNPHADRHFYAPVTRPYLLLAWLRSRRYDILIDSSQWARIGAVLTNLSGALLTVGFDTQRQYRAFGYDFRARHSPDRHEVENFLELGRAIWPGFTGTPSLKQVEQARCYSDRIYCHMWPAPGPRRELKEWPEAHWRDLIGALVENGYEINLTGSLADRPACDAFKVRHFNGRSAVRVIAGECGLVELAGHFQSARAVIAVNTGIMHLASLAGAPTIGLHGATNPARWGPVGSNAVSLLPLQGQYAYLNLGYEYPAHAKPAMAQLPVAAVLAALERLSLPGRRGQL